MSLFEKDTIKDEKIENIVNSLLQELDKVDQWYSHNSSRIYHKHYNLDVWREEIFEPHSIKIPRKWRREVNRKIRGVTRHIELKRMDFVQAVLDHQYPIQIKHPTKDQIIWCKENGVEYTFDTWLYIKEGDGAMAFKLRWS